MNTKHTINQLLSGSVLRTGSVVIHAGIAFFMMPFLVHTLGTRDYGLWVLAGTFMGYYGFLDFGLAPAVGRFISKAVGESNLNRIYQVTSTSFYLFLSIGVCVILLSIVVATLVDIFVSNPTEAKLFAAIIVVLGISVGTQFPLRMFGGVLTSLARYDILAVIEITKAIIRTIITVYFVSSGYGILTLACITLVVELCGNAWQIYLTYRNSTFINLKLEHFSFQTAKDLFGYGWVAFVGIFSDGMKFKILPTIVAAFVSIEAVVVYSVSLRLVEYFQQFVLQAVGMFMPVFSRLEGSGNIEQVRKGFTYITSLGISVALFIGWSIWIYGDIFITLWMGSDFHISYELIIIMLLPITFMLMQVSTRDLFFGLSKQKFFAYINLTELALIVVFGILFTTLLGIKGIAWGVFLGILLPEMVKPWLVSNILHISVINIYGNIFRHALGSTLILLPFAYFLNHEGAVDSYLDIIVWGTIQTIWYMVLMYTFVFSPELKLLLKRHTPLGKVCLKRAQPC